MKDLKPWGQQRSCAECMYKKGLVKTFVNPCPTCPANKKGLSGLFGLLKPKKKGASDRDEK